MSSSDIEIDVFRRNYKNGVGQKLAVVRLCDPYESLIYPFDSAFRLLSRRWTPEILFHIIGGTTRYSRLQKSLPGISPRTLSVRISELEKAGVITRTGRTRVECVYLLTQKGAEVKEVLDKIADFSVRWHTQEPS